MMKERFVFAAVSAAALLAVAAMSLPAPAQAQPINNESDRADCLEKHPYAPEQAQVGLDEATRSVFIKTPCGWQYIRKATPAEVSKIKELSSPIPVPPQVLAKALNEIRQEPMMADALSHS
jgi:hypothetical protein